MFRMLMIFAVILGGWSSSFAECSAADKKALEALDREWGGANLRGDRAAVERILADDYISIAPAGTQNKKETIDAAMRTFEQARTNPNPPPTPTYDHYVIQCTPTSATVTHRNIVTNIVDGKPRVTYGRSVHVMEKRGPRWAVVSNAGQTLSDGGVIAFLEHDWNNATTSRDYGWFEKNLTDDFTSITSRKGQLSSRSEMLDEMRNDKWTLESMDLSELNVRVNGDTAVVTGINRIRGRDEAGKPFERRVRFTDTMRRDDDQWKFWASQGTLIQ